VLEDLLGGCLVGDRGEEAKPAAAVSAAEDVDRDRASHRRRGGDDHHGPRRFGVRLAFMSQAAAGIRSLSIALPSFVKTNDDFRRLNPALVASAEEKMLARAFSPLPGGAAGEEAGDPWSEEMAPYLADPFRGGVERRLLAEGETALDLQARAGREALAAAGLSPGDIDLVIAVSFIPEQITPGDAVFVAARLGIAAPAWNLESTCSGAVVALQTAAALVRAGEHRRVLVIVCNTYSRFTGESDTLAFLSGDGAGAFVVSAAPEGQGVLASKMVSTASTCGAFYTEIAPGAEGRAQLFIRADPSANRMLRDSTSRYVRSAVLGAVEAAGKRLDDVAFFVFSTPTAWYTRVCARVLAIDPERTISMHREYGNAGASLPLLNLYHAAHAGKIRPGDLVVLYAVASSSNAGAVVMRWGEVPLGPPPAPPRFASAKIAG
jgi:3-oxoacyl-[acyl-carrier-protein] synthase III